MDFVVLSAVTDLLLGLVDQPAAVARVRDNGEEAAVCYFCYKFREILVCSLRANFEMVQMNFVLMKPCLN
jgi:hypothetical protein